MARSYVVDTNIVSAVLRQDRAAATRLDEAFRLGGTFYLCPVVYYEVVRGLLHTPVPGMVEVFDEMRRSMLWQEFTPTDWQCAARLWAEFRSAGRPRGDADILIGAYALSRSAVLVTADERHFAGLGLTTENWRDE